MAESGLEEKIRRHLRNRSRIGDERRDLLEANARAHIDDRAAQAKEFLAGAPAVDASNNAVDPNMFEPIGDSIMQLALLDITGPGPVHVDVLGNSTQHIPPEFPGAFNQQGNFWQFSQGSVANQLGA